MKWEVKLRTRLQLYACALIVLTVFIFPTISLAVPPLQQGGHQPAAEFEGNSLQAGFQNRDTPQGNIQVDTLEDELNSDGDCSLREAVTAANNNTNSDNCQAGSGVDLDTITFAVTGTITLNTPLNVNASGPLVIDGGSEVTISGGDSVRIFYVNTGTNLTLKNLSLIDGYSSEGGGIYNLGTLTVNSSTLSGNNSSSSGAGIKNNGTLYVTNSTLSGNSANFYGGGIHNQATLTVSSSTITENNAQVGGGIYSTGTGLAIKNSILASNSASINSPDCYATTASSGGFNLLSNKEECGFIPTAGDLTSVDPQLGPLQDNNGPTPTHALLPGSLAISQGDPDGCTDHLGSPLATDQRGLPRSDRCDIGAFELQPASAGAYVLYLPTVSKSCGSILYHDDFSNPNSGWPKLQNEDRHYEYLGGEYSILVINRLDWAAASPGFKASEYVAVVDVRNINDIPGSYGIIFGLSNDWSQLYSFEINPSGNYWLFRKASSAWKILASGSTGFIQPGTAANQLKVERIGNRIWAYINGQLVNVLEDNYYTGLRAYGLVAASYNQPEVDIRFDNFSLYPSSCGAQGAFLNQSDGIDTLKIQEVTPLTYWESILHGR